MATDTIDTHAVEIDFGKHAGTRLPRVPVSYLRWLANTPMERTGPGGVPWPDYARAELARRGTTLPTIEVSGHAIDSASLRARKTWHEHRGPDEGLHRWLVRSAAEARQYGATDPDNPDRLHYLGLVWVFEAGEEFPVLKTLLPQKRGRRPTHNDEETTP